MFQYVFLKASDFILLCLCCKTDLFAFNFPTKPLTFTKNIRNEIKLANAKIEVIEANANAKIEVIEANANAKIEAANGKIEAAKRETAERFLLYGYAEEFNRYQKEVGIYRGDESSKVADKAS